MTVALYVLLFICVITWHNHKSYRYCNHIYYILITTHFKKKVLLALNILTKNTSEMAVNRLQPVVAHLYSIKLFYRIIYFLYKMN